jgi:histidine triad (HIT) family protein
VTRELAHPVVRRSRSSWAALLCATVDGDCLVCRELGGDIPVPGGLLWREKDAVAFHVPPVEEIGNARPYLGHLLVVTQRHVASLGEPTPEETAAVGRAAARLAKALVDAGGAEWVYSAVIGTGVPHFHLHLLPRFAGTPRDLPWRAVDEWEGARRGGAEEIAEFVGLLTASLIDMEGPAPD